MSASPSSSSAASEPIATPEHAHYCFDVLAAHLSPVSPPYAASSPPEPRFANAADAYAVFVTWETLRAGREPRLRGCIGNFAPRELGSQLREYAIVACVPPSVPSGPELGSDDALAGTARGDDAVLTCGSLSFSPARSRTRGSGRSRRPSCPRSAAGPSVSPPSRPSRHLD